MGYLIDMRQIPNPLFYKAESLQFRVVVNKYGEHYLCEFLKACQKSALECVYQDSERWSTIVILLHV